MCSRNGSSLFVSNYYLETTSNQTQQKYKQTNDDQTNKCTHAHTYFY